MNKILPIMFVFVLLLSVFVTAGGTTQYLTTGTEDGTYNLNGTGTFNSGRETTDINIAARSLSSPRVHPVIGDMNGDGINEIVVLDGDTVIVYNNKELDIQATLDLGPNEPTSNPLLFDIDGDGNLEYIIAQESSEFIQVVSYNGTALNLDTSISFSSISHSGGDTVINCRSANSCLMAASFRQDSVNGVGASFVLGVFFNSTSIGGDITLESSSSGQNAFCFPTIKSMPAVDYDQDGDIEYVLGYGMIRNTFSEYQIRYINTLDNTSSVILEQSVDISDATDGLSTGGSFSCNAAIPQGAKFTAATVFDFNPSKSNLETLVAYKVDTFEYEMREILADGTIGDQFPETILGNGEGEIVSNVMAMNGCPSSSSDTLDACVMAYLPSDQMIELTCGSKDGNCEGIFESARLEFDVSGRFNITNSFQNFNPMAHAGQHSNALTNGKDLNEIINAYGILSLNYAPIFDNVMVLEFQNPAADSVLLSIDVEAFGADDLLAQTSTNLFYFDDRLSNEPGRISAVTFNPCIVDSVIKVNTTLQVLVTVKDQNDPSIGFDAVTSIVRSYFNTNDEVNVSLGPSASGTIFQHTFILNKTGVTNILRIEGADTANPLEVDVITQTFNVQNQGIEFGDSQCSLNIVITPDVGVVPTGISNLTAADNSSLKVGAEQIRALTGLPTIIFWILIMFIFSLIVWFDKSETDSFMKIGFLILGNFFLIFIGIALNYLSAAIIVVLFFLMIAVGSFFIWRMFQRS